jgi:hypothetical protein
MVVIRDSKLRRPSSLLAVDFDLLKWFRAASAIPADDTTSTIFFKAGTLFDVLYSLIFKTLK